MNNIEKGIVGEQEVINIIKKAIKLNQIQARIYNNVILEFPSMYGDNGYLTTELDHIIVTDYFVYIIETKNEHYMKCSYKDEQWKLMSNEEVSNPLIQNRLHKNIFCSELGVDRKKVMTIECLLKCDDMQLTTQYPNDYVCTRKNLLNVLCLLLRTKYNEKVDSNLNIKIKKYEDNSKNKADKHKEMLKTTEKIEKWTKTHEGHYNFTRTDISICPKCGARLVFRPYKGKDYSRGNVRKTQQYLIGCLNFAKESCDFHKCYSKKRGTGFDEIIVTSLEHRLGWIGLEEKVETILDQYERQKIIIAKLRENTESQNTIIEKQKLEISNLNKKNNEACEIIKKIQNQFTHFLGPFYLKK